MGEDQKQDQNNPARNPSQELSDDLFDFEKAEEQMQQASTPSELAAQDQRDASMRDASTYDDNSPGSSVRILNPGAENDDEKSGLMKYEQGDGEPKGRLGRFRQKAANSKLLNGLSGESKTRKRILLAFSGISGIGLIVVAFFFIFLFISGFNIGQVAKSLRSTAFAGIHYANYRRLTQLEIQNSIETATGAESRELRNLKGTSLYDKFRRYNSQKILTNLGQEGKFRITTFTDVDGARRLITEVNGERFLQPKISTTDRIFSPIESYKQAKEYRRGIESAAKEIDLLKTASRYTRSRAGKDILDASGASLTRWQEAGRRIRNFADNLKSRSEKLRKPSSYKPSLDDAKKGTDNVDEILEERFDDLDDIGGVRTTDPTTGEVLFDSIPDEIADEAVKKSASRINKIARAGTFIPFAATLYCTANDYINGLDARNEDRDSAFKRQGFLPQTTYDQYEAGDVTAEAVVQESKLYDGFQDSPDYQLDIGNPNVLATTQWTGGLDESDMPYQKNDGKLYESLDAITPPPGTGGSIINTLCGALTSPAGTGVSVALEAVLTAASAGSGRAGAEGVKISFRETLRQSFTTSAGRKIIAKRIAADGALILGLNYLINNIVKDSSGLDNAGLGDGADTYSRARVGTKMWASEEALYSGGRALTTPESIGLKKLTTEQRIAQMQKKPLLERLSMSNIYSPTSQFIASIPVTKSRASKKATGFLASAFNPLVSFASSTQRLATARVIPEGSAYAIGPTNMYGFPDVGYSAGELEKMLEEDYFPYQNTAWVESNGGPEAFEDIDACLSKGLLNLLKKTDSTGETGECSAEKMSTDRAFRYRLYKMDEAMLDMGLEIQEGPQVGSPTATSKPVSEGVIGLEDTATTSNGGGIIMRKDLVPKVEAMVDAATKAGVALTGTGWRDTNKQIELRKKHCGTSEFDIYKKSPSACRPPTARPGSSNHERGTAIDFKNCSSRSTSCFKWLAQNAATYGFYNLPSEPWHWSVDGG